MAQIKRNPHGVIKDAVAHKTRKFRRKVSESKITKPSDHWYVSWGKSAVCGHLCLFVLIRGLSAFVDTQKRR